MIGCIIQARMGSTRLPGKIMKLLDEKNPSLYYTINQLKNCKTFDKIIVATTTLNEDNVVEEYLKNLDIDIFRGNSEDVLDRYYECAKYYELTSIIRITGDCPLIDPCIVDHGVDIFQSKLYDYVTNTFPRTFPDGNEVEIFSFTSLEKAWNNAKLPSEREHVTPYFKNFRNIFKVKNFKHNDDISYLRWTMDFEEDLKLIKIIISKIFTRPIYLQNILNLLKQEPKLIKINNNHEPNEGFQRSLKQDQEFLKDK